MEDKKTDDTGHTHDLTLIAVRFDGVLQITDLTTFNRTLEQGVGSGKGFGFGLLSVAPSEVRAMRSLHELPRFRDRWSYLYLEKGRMEVDGSGLKFSKRDRDGRYSSPHRSTGCYHARSRNDRLPTPQYRSLAQNNCLLTWTGEQGVRLYAANTGGTFSARRIIRQAALVSDERSRIDVAKRMYQFRFAEPLPGRCTHLKSFAAWKAFACARYMPKLPTQCLA